MVVSNMSPSGVVVVDTETLQYMSPGAEIMSMQVEVDVFPAQYTVHSVSALRGVAP